MSHDRRKPAGLHCEGVLVCSVITAVSEGALTSDLIDGEADGVHVLAVAAVAAAIFLHQSHQEAAGCLVILRVVILLQQADFILRVDPECVCRDEASWEM